MIHYLLLSITAVVLSFSAVATEDGFEDLLAGDSLSKWKSSGDYKLENGVVSGKKGRLFSKKEYGNFILRFDFKLEAGTNNGLAIRTPGGKRPIELQIIDNTAKKFAKIKDYQRHGSLYNYVPAKVGHLKPVGEWNSQEVSCNGSMVTVTLNGTVIMEADLTKVSPIGDRYVVDYITAAKKGYLGFLGHNTPIHLRKIRIRDLD